MENDLRLAIQDGVTIYVIDLPSYVSIPEFYEGVSRLFGNRQISLSYNNVDLSAYWEWCLADFEFENGALIQVKVASDDDSTMF
jgi:hypothetical protein